MARSQKSLIIVTPYVTMEGAQVLLQALAERKSKNVLLLRFVTLPQGDEYVTGFVQPEALLCLQEAGFEIRVLERLHAKIYFVDGETVFLGSANVTQTGLGAAEHSNREIMIRHTVQATEARQLVDVYWDDASLPNPALSTEYVLQVERLANEYRARTVGALREIKAQLPTRMETKVWPDDRYLGAVRMLLDKRVIHSFERASSNEFILNGKTTMKTFYSAQDPVTSKFSFDIVESTGEEIRNGKYDGVLLILGDGPVLGIPRQYFRKVLLRKYQMREDDWQFKVTKVSERWTIQIGRGKSQTLVDIHDFLWQVP
ncbi:MAG: phospholipase D-like domain-containing protein [Alicyclobacillaceae bacterium]|nr:phospholipase D-like domain-containing protein [Alicyclobacillaceae bacterium]